MKKFTKILAGVTALFLTFGIVGCAKDYPDFISMSSTTPGEEETSEKYTVNVRSAGGLKLNGIRVCAYNSAGTLVRKGLSSDGVINFGLPLGEYTLEVDEETLPDGYYLEEDATYKTNPSKRESVNISIPSTVIKQTASASKVYALGEIVNDFVIEDYRTYSESYTGTKNYKLSDLLKTKKAVILNFWYPTCTNCTAEFPYLQAAYASAGSDIEVLGICTPSFSKTQIADYVQTHKEKGDFTLTFPLGIDTSGIANKYNVSGWPTSVVIDRYGMLAYWDSGAQPSLSFWQSLFKHYAADDYVQDPEISDNPDDPDKPISGDREKPNVTMPSSAKMAQAASAPGLNATYKADADDEYAWPWTTGTDEIYGSVITVTNSGKDSSYSTLYVEIPLKKDDLLSFDYMISSELNADMLYVLLDGQLLNADGWSGKIGWTTADMYVADRDKTVELSFIYMKDEGDPGADEVGEDTVRITNIRTSKVSDDMEALDVIREAASGTVSAEKYEHYVNAVLGSDGFYHVDSADGPLLYISLSNITPWSELHTKNNQFNTEYGFMYASLYTMTYYKYAETIEDDDGNMLAFTVNIGDTDFSEPLVAYNHMLPALEKPYQLMPVSEQLRDWAESFTTEYAKEIGKTSHENEWLEFCFYYDHYGKSHGKNEVCLMDTDITKGLTIYNPYEIGFKSTPAVGESLGENLGRITAKVVYPLSNPNSLYYKFTAPADGVYQIRDYGGSAYPQLEVLTLLGDKMNAQTVNFFDGVPDFDQFTGTSYNSFNSYIVLSEGQTVYLSFRIDEQTTGSFDFDIIYHDRVDKLLNATTGDGAWTYDKNGVFIYLGIKVAYDSATDRYFHDDGRGTPDRDEPVYINMIYENFFISSLQDGNFMPIEELIDANLFARVSATAQAEMRSYLEKAKQNTGEMYGLVEADSRIVEILNSLIDMYGGAGDNRGWLAFACYTEHYAHSATKVADEGNLAVGWNDISFGESANATVTFTAPDAGIYSFSVPEGGSVSYNGGNVLVTDGVAEVLLFKGETVTISVTKGTGNASVAAFKKVNMNETKDGGELDVGNNIISGYDQDGKATLTFTAPLAGNYELDLSAFGSSATVTVDGVAVSLTDGVAKLTLVSGQEVTVKVSDTGERTIFALKLKTKINEIDDGEELSFGGNIIGEYDEKGSAALIYEETDRTFTDKEVSFRITVTDYEELEISVGGKEVTIAESDGTATATVALKRGDKVTVTVKKKSGAYKHTGISIGYAPAADGE